MTEEILVSVIIPVYNCAPYLEKCLASVADQSFRNLQIIVVNDGSTDGSLKLIEQFAGSDDRFCLVDQENRGVSCARNTGAGLVRGKYMTFLDGDDYIGRDYIRNFVCAAERGQAELCVCGYTMVDEDGKVLFQTGPEREYRQFDHEEYPYRILATLSRFYRSDFWRERRIFYEENRNIRGEDIPVALWTNALAKRIECVAQAEYFYVQHVGSARSQMRGLRSWSLPFQALETCIKHVMRTEETNSKAFFEMGVIRVFVTFLFDLGRGASKERLKELYFFEKRMIQAYFPDCWKNRLFKLRSGLDIPAVQRVAVRIYLFLFRFHMLYAAVFCMGIFARKRENNDWRDNG